MKRIFSFGLLVLGVGLLPGYAACAFSLGARAAGSLPLQRGAASHSPQGYLGVDLRDVAEEQMSALRVKDTHGAEIIRVDHDGPAGKMGLREHDVVVQMNGVTVEGEEHIRRMLRDTAPGRAVVLVISRDGQQMTMTAQMADRNEVERRAWEQHLTAPALPPHGLHGPQAPANALPGDDDGSTGAPAISASAAPNTRYSKSFLGTLLMSPAYTGVMLERMSPQLAEFFGVPTGSGLLVRSVENNSPAMMAGLHAGDVVIRANAQTVATPTDWARTIRDAKGRPVSVTVLRDRQEKTLRLTPDAKKRSSLEFPFGNLGKFSANETWD